MLIRAWAETASISCCFLCRFSPCLSGRSPSMNHPPLLPPSLSETGSTHSTNNQDASPADRSRPSLPAPPRTAPRCLPQANFGPDQAKALKMSSMEPMTEVDPSSGTANPPRRRSTYKDALEVSFVAPPCCFLYRQDVLGGPQRRSPEALVSSDQDLIYRTVYRLQALGSNKMKFVPKEMLRLDFCAGFSNLSFRGYKV